VAGHGVKRKTSLVCALMLGLGCEPPPPAPTAATTNTAGLEQSAPTPGASANPSATASGTAPDAEPWLADTLRRGDPRWTGWLAGADALKLQILVRVVEPGRDDRIERFRADAEYTYPASAIKPYLAVAALRRLNRDAEKPIALRSSLMRCRDDEGGCQPPREDVDPNHKPGPDGKKKHKKLRVGQEIHKLLAWSDNDAYNRLWDIVGHREVNEEVLAMGFPAVRMHHKMSAPAERSKKTLRTTVLPPGHRGLVYKRRVSDLVLGPTPAKNLLIGQAHNDAGKRIDGPLDFGMKNHASLADLQRILLSVVSPEHADAAKLELSVEQRDHLLKAMTRKPRSGRHADHAPLFPGVVEVIDASEVRYISKSGRAYGFQLENAYIEHLASKRAIYVTTVVYANPNGVLNDDVYAYGETSRPLLAALGEALARSLLVP
jgi:Beta-lactamase enzyme family